MRSLLPFCLLGVACATATPAPTPVAAAPVAPAPVEAAKPPVEDPFLWLEDVSGEQAMQWVKARNERTFKELGTTEQVALKERLLTIYNSADKIPYVRKQGQWLYNMWLDPQHKRGLLRRTTLAEYKKDKPAWETVLDVDALAEAEHESWFLHGRTCLAPKYERCLLTLSRGGADAAVVREFDMVKKQFVTDGFTLPEAKSTVSWKDENTLFVSTDFGPGSLTESGYPRLVKLWKRGTPLASAEPVFEATVSDIGVGAAREWNQGQVVDVVYRELTTFTNETSFLDQGKLVKVNKPDDAEAFAYRDFLLLRLRTDWRVGDKTWLAGSLLVTNRQKYLKGQGELEALFVPTAQRSLSDVVMTKNALVLGELQDVTSKFEVARFEKGKWAKTELAVPVGHYSISEYDGDTDDQYWFSGEDFTHPSRLELGDLKSPKRQLLKSAPAFFDAAGLEVKQFFATSKDGTKVPYFQVSKANLALDGSSPVLLNGYGGFEIPELPFYSGSVGAAWLERGGVFALANIRGGGEYGPQWHQAAIKSHRQVAYDDFISIAEDLIARKVTSAKHLGIQGGSNGGLLMGVMVTERPDLWGAVVCSAPLLDMKRYHKLLAGASWVGEYGNPDLPEEWEWISKYSPYQNVKKDAKYPRVLFTTSTRDDRVHPGHARKMAARMLDQGHDVLFYENIEGGHAGAADNQQRANLVALEYEFLWRELSKK